MTRATAWRIFLPGVGLALLASCATKQPRTTRVVSEDEVYQIAVATVTRHEGWPASNQVAPNIVECILCMPQLNSDGSWRVIANRAEVEVSSGNNEFIPHTGRTILISRDGRVTQYNRIPSS